MDSDAAAAPAAYPRETRSIPLGVGVLTPAAPDKLPCRLNIPVALPGATILVHGVNDVGTGYALVEEGLCAGLVARLRQAPGAYVPARYRLPGDPPEDRTEVLDDPDAVYYQRQLDERVHSPVIPFYWGFREVESEARSGTQHPHGQNLDRYGNRLDRDNAKGGGPFVNATTTLPDLWASGHGALPSKDAIRPVHEAPGRLYFVLAAQRLAALIAMIRDWSPGDAVNLVAHSQGTLLSLLAQAMLLERGLAPADTLVLCASPYSLEDELTDFDFGGGRDAAMKQREYALHGRQTLHARLQTLVNIVAAARERRATEPPFDDGLKDGRYRGLAGSGWSAAADRDNRGKVYLYFCPEDMTVSLLNVQGIGWQGVPDTIRGQQLGWGVDDSSRPQLEPIERQALSELSASGGFGQRVFTLKQRPDPNNGAPVLVGKAPHDFALTVPGEDFHAHAPWVKGSWADEAARILPRHLADRADRVRRGIRRINAEALKTPVLADLQCGALPAAEAPGGAAGAYERVDPSDAAIAATVASEYRKVWQLLDEAAPSGWQLGTSAHPPIASPAPDVHAGPVVADAFDLDALRERINRDRPAAARSERVTQAWRCLERYPTRPSGQILIERMETPLELRRRFQTQQTSGRSYHSAIYASRLNHQQVTAYDVSIGTARALEDPEFREYLYAVADWKLKKQVEGGPKVRANVFGWSDFLARFGKYYRVEPSWRKQLIEGTCDYYSTGVLPTCIALLPEGLPSLVLSETKTGWRLDRSTGSR